MDKFNVTLNGFISHGSSITVHMGARKWWVQHSIWCLIALFPIDELI